MSSDQPSDVFDRLRQLGIVPVVEIADADRAVPLAEALAAGGLPVVEVTFRTPAAAQSLRRIAKAVPQVLLMAGTATSVEQVDLALDSGVAIVVAPGLNRGVVERAMAIGLPILPGVLTPSEVDAALALGLSAVKVFPIEPVGGISYLRALAGPFPRMRWSPTGGISADALPAYLKLPSVLSCGGSWLAPRADIEAGRFDDITARAAKAARIVRQARAGT